MRPSFRSAGSFVTLVSSLLVASVAIVACGGETASLGSQGSEQGAGGKAGSAGSGGTNGGGSTSSGGSSAGGSNNGSSGAGGSDVVGCPTIDLTCDAGSQHKTYDANGCQRCEACPAIPAFLGDCPNGTRDVRDVQTGCITKTVCKDDDILCPELTPPHPDFCSGGELVPTTDANGCATAPGCLCPPAQACPPNTKAVPKANGACGVTCQPSSCPEVIEPGPYGCPSGGFVTKYDANGCINGFDCKSCPVLGDPSYCADGIIRVGIKADGTCDYGKISCVECLIAAVPDSANWCNDGAVIRKMDGKCLTAAQCSCPDYGACPPNAGSLPTPGSFCGAFECNDVNCPDPTAPPAAFCAGKYVWERDANGCATQAVCKPKP